MGEITGYETPSEATLCKDCRYRETAEKNISKRDTSYAYHF